MVVHLNGRFTRAELLFHARMEGPFEDDAYHEMRLNSTRTEILAREFSRAGRLPHLHHNHPSDNTILCSYSALSH